MKQISTGAGLVALSVGMVATAFIATHRGGSEAFAQGTGGERHIVAHGVYQGGAPYPDGGFGHWAYRVWSDNVTEVKYLGFVTTIFDSNDRPIAARLASGVPGVWQIVDSGSPAFMPADVDRSGQVDSGDIAQVLLNFTETVDQTTPPPIDCNINAPR